MHAHMLWVKSSVFEQAILVWVNSSLFAMPPKKKQKGKEKEKELQQPDKAQPAKWSEEAVHRLISLASNGAMTHREITDALGSGFSPARVKAKISALRDEGRLPQIPNRDESMNTLHICITNDILVGKELDTLFGSAPSPSQSQPAKSHASASIALSSGMKAPGTLTPVMVHTTPRIDVPSPGTPLHFLYTGSKYFILIVWKLARHTITANFRSTGVHLRFEPDEGALKPRQLLEGFPDLDEDCFEQSFFEQGLHHLQVREYEISLPCVIVPTHDLIIKWVSEDTICYYLPFEVHGNTYL